MTFRPVEVCVADAESLVAALAGGADRIELCSALEIGGLTPSAGLMRLAAAAPVPVYAMVRPRSGDFVYGPGDVDVMLSEIAAIRAAGLAGVVIGASLPGGALDRATLSRLLDAADGLGSTLHRAFDLVPDITEATEMAVELGFERILTSGGKSTALAGSAAIAETMAAARGRVAIMAGSGLTPETVVRLLDRVAVDEVHGTCATPVATLGQDAVRLGFAGATRRVTSAAIVSAFRHAVSAHPR